MKTDFLRKGEKVLWEGRPVRSATGIMEWRNLCGGFFELLALGALIGVYILSTPEWQPPLAILLGLIAALAGFGPVMTLYRLRGQHYWITNCRAVVVSRDGNVYSMELPDIRALELVDEDCVVMSNEPLSGTLGQAWRIASHPQSARSAEDQTSADAIAFFHTDHAGEALRLLHGITTA